MAKTVRLNPTLWCLPEVSEGYMWKTSQVLQLGFLLEVKYCYPFSDPLETLLSSTFQGFQRTLFFHRILVVHAWTSGFCWNPMLLCILVSTIYPSLHISLAEL